MLHRFAGSEAIQLNTTKAWGSTTTDWLMWNRCIDSEPMVICRSTYCFATKVVHQEPICCFLLDSSKLPQQKLGIIENPTFSQQLPLTVHCAGGPGVVVPHLVFLPPQAPSTWHTSRVPGGNHRCRTSTSGLPRRTCGLSTSSPAPPLYGYPPYYSLAVESKPHVP